jgi:hypothetical protein
MGVMTSTTMRLNRRKLLLLHPALLFIGVLCLIVDPALSDDRPTLPTPSIPVVMKVKAVSPSEAGIGDRVRVEIQNLAAAIEKDGLDPRKLALYLDDRVMPGIYAELVGDRTSNVLEFNLERTDKSKQAWLPLLGSPRHSIRKVKLSVGYADKEQIPAVDPTSHPTLNLRVFHFTWFVACTIGFVILLGLFIWLARSSALLRDSTLVDLTDTRKQKPYSLARVQMAVWFFLVLSSLLFINLITDDYNTVTDQTLMLIGIGAGTALGAAVIDVGKRNVVNREQESLDGLIAETETLSNEKQVIEARIAATPPGTPQDVSALRELQGNFSEKRVLLAEAKRRVRNVSSGVFIKDGSVMFLLDLLTDANGVNFHRFQMLVWTVVLSFLFCVEVYKNLAMPEFSETLLALMGISSGTYLGLKIPEAQS